MFFQRSCANHLNFQEIKKHLICMKCARKVLKMHFDHGNLSDKQLNIQRSVEIKEPKTSQIIADLLKNIDIFPYFAIWPFNISFYALPLPSGRVLRYFKTFLNCWESIANTSCRIWALFDFLKVLFTGSYHRSIFLP